MNDKLARTEAPVPAYLAHREAEGIDPSQNFGSTPRIKVVQGTTDVDLRKTFPPGTAIITPDHAIVAAAGKPFHGVTLYFWPAWEQWRDQKDKNPMPVVESSLDPDSDLARRAKNPATRDEVYPEDANADPKKQRYFRFVESLNFALLILDGPAAGSVAVASFSRGGHKRGAQLHGYLKRRNVPIYANRVRFVVGDETNKSGDTWSQLRHEPADQVFVAEGELDAMRKLYLRLKAAWTSRTLGVAAVKSDPIEAPPDGDESI